MPYVYESEAFKIEGEESLALFASQVIANPEGRTPIGIKLPSEEGGADDGKMGTAWWFSEDAAIRMMDEIGMALAHYRDSKRYKS